MNKTILGYVPEESPIYNLHPFVRVYFLMIVSLWPMIISSPEWNFALIVVVLILLEYSRVTLSTLKLYVPVSVSMGVLILLSYTILGGRHPEFYEVFNILGMPIYFERIVAAVEVYMRILPMIFVMVFFLSTSRERDILVAMRWARMPFTVTYLVAMSLRAVGMVIEDFSIVRQAEKARGYDPKGKSIPYKLRQFVMYIIPLMGLAIRRSEEFANALVARGYSFTGLRRVKRPDYVLTKYRFKALDGIIVIILTLALILLVFARYGLGMFTLEGSLTMKWLQQWLVGGAG
ncbi:MAG TPA: energy-coupling factor transporter transmembrane protein EcfT [Candidatus Acetothermia bacterium]|nr:energy-coupling factor transporter transmembrane protein EcfT [Candidatus Acetothermia bacterium]